MSICAGNTENADRSLQHSHFADELTAKCVDDTSDRRGFALADEVEVQHTLDSTRLQTTKPAESEYI